MLANVFRFVLAITFIFSGFVKLVDPIGSLYKIQDYFIAFGLGGLLPNAVMIFIGAFFAIIEFTLGTCYFWGIRRKLTTWLSLLLMVFMTTLTFYLAVTDSVSDCGCFGDVVVLTNWQTFLKNIFLLTFVIITFKWKKRIIPFISANSQWLVSLFSILYSICLIMYCFHHLPVLDFRPYKIGKNILQEMMIPDDAKPSVYETTFLLSKDGKKKEFTIDNYPDSTWTFVEAKTKLIEKGFEPTIHDFSLIDLETYDDLTHKVLTDTTYTFFLIANRLDKADDGNIDLINEIYDYSTEHGYGFYCLTSSPEEDILAWQDRAGAEYPFCLVDEITLKTMIRSNPGLMLIKNGTILNKWNQSDIPDEYELDGRGLEYTAFGEIKPVNDARTIGLAFLWYIIPLLIVLGFDSLWVLHQKRKNAKQKVVDKDEDLENLI